ncbi:hypothetical protein [uncultured Sphingorhabdus sp.]|uniref:hypothetical protein n=1 Tax=uncultured Sphingorhabdus sp. TaxID=1686106 RepID=UPI0026206264|nr:hypothetical protein [uncultured Sphingorhabdus sp.]HMS20026.1 hypothetical protein [Sphingorhabdus sp.]
MTDLPETTNPLMALAQEAVPSVQAAFAARFEKPIDVSVHQVTNEATGERKVEFRFTPSRPGLLPTAIERAWFDAFMAGFQRCHECACEMFVIDGEPH